MKAWLNSGKTLFHQILSEEEGQSMVFGAITLFTVACFMVLVFNIGDVSSRKIQIQNAADAAAYSGAAVEANSLSTITWINDGMAFVYYNIMRYAVDYILYDVLSRYKRYHPIYPAPDKVIGLSGVKRKYRQAERIAKEWIPRGQRWLKNLAQIERGIARATPWLMKKEIIETARANGAEAVALWPEPNFDISSSKGYLKEDKKFRFTEGTRMRQFQSKYGGFPTWWRPYFGMSVIPYAQVRKCWNWLDRHHFPPVNPHGPYWRHVPGSMNRDKPAGHFHLPHTHIFVKIPYPDINGHLDFPHLPFTDPAPPDPRHHAVMICPTCWNFDNFYVRIPRDGITDVMKVQGYNFGPVSVPNPFRKNQRIDFSAFDLPLIPRKELFENGVNVIVWRSYSTNTLISRVFKNPRYGYFAIASAKIGVDLLGTIRTQVPSWLFNLRGLYEPLEFGAKLVPIKEGHKGGLRKVLDGLSRARWYTSYPNPDGRLSAKLQRYLRELGPGGTSLPSLERLIHH
ncbi:MAG: hypothetical protein D6805_00800 [Planctomycetota bacterium]|nr:MAG: hypothetical protein D6805_00800 [Planctomycetota bacterium]